MTTRLRLFGNCLLACAAWMAVTPRAQAAAPRGKSAELVIPAAHYWADTGVRVEEGKCYTVQVVDFGNVRDATIPVRDLRGWPPSVSQVLFAPFFWARRRPLEPWFSVIASVDRKHPVRLRADRPYVAPASGELVCYFNDASWAYGNNHGTGRLRLTEMRCARSCPAPVRR